MTPAMRFLRHLFFRSPKAAEDRERRLAETRVRVDHAHRLIGNSFDRLNENSNRLRDLQEGIVSDSYVEAIRQLDATLKTDDR